MTVEELIAKLKTCYPTAEVKCSVWQSHITEAGSDLGGYYERDIREVNDLEKRVVIEVRDY